MSWLTLSSYIAAAALAAASAWFVTRLVYEHQIDTINAASKAAIESQKTSDANACTAAQKVTSDVDTQYQSQIADLDAQLTAAKRVRSAKCVPIYIHTVSTTVVSNGAAHHQQTHADGGVDRDALLDYAGDGNDSCEGLRRQLNSLQDWVELSQ